MARIYRMIRAIVFDLDGTLVDTLGDIAVLMNGYLRSKAWPEHRLADYRLMVGRGLANLIRAAVPRDQVHGIDELYAEVFAEYEAMGIGSSLPYPGVAETLGILAARGTAMAVVSNKPDPITRNMVETLFPTIRFALIRGGIDGVPAKPDPFSTLEAAKACGVPPMDCAFVGDSDVDMATAAAAGMLAIGASWGFRGEKELREAGADIIIGSMDELPALVEKTGTSA
jgi:phosphoglycolate phosphatase